jgi:hypothetical protein
LCILIIAQGLAGRNPASLDPVQKEVMLGEGSSYCDAAGSQTVRRIGMKRMVYVLIAVCLFGLSACGGAGPPGEPVTKAEDVLGVWRRTKRLAQWERGIYMQLRADGTMGFSMVPDKWDYEWMSLDFAFDGTQCSVTETAFRGGGRHVVSCATGIGAPSGVYEIQLLASGNLKFANAQDNCYWRHKLFTEAEWEPVQ